MMSRVLVWAAVMIVASSGAAVAGGSYLDADPTPRMAPEDVEDRVRPFNLAATESATGMARQPSVRCTRIDRLGLPTEHAEGDTRTVWVVELLGAADADGVFYVIDDDTAK